MPRQARQRGEVRLDLNLTPLLDVVLQLITFFMMLIHFGSKIEGATKSIHLPVAPAALPSGDLGPDQMIVLVNARGTLLGDGEEQKGDVADAWWARQAARRREGQKLLGVKSEELPTLVIIRADKDAPYGSVRTTLVKAQDHGFAHFSLVVLRGREQ